jgi:hypothetical protein
MAESMAIGAGTINQLEVIAAPIAELFQTQLNFEAFHFNRLPAHIYTCQIKFPKNQKPPIGIGGLEKSLND